MPKAQKPKGKKYVLKITIFYTDYTRSMRYSEEDISPADTRIPAGWGLERVPIGRSEKTQSKTFTVADDTAALREVQKDYDRLELLTRSESSYVELAEVRKNGSRRKVNFHERGSHPLTLE